MAHICLSQHAPHSTALQHDHEVPFSWWLSSMARVPIAALWSCIMLAKYVRYSCWCQGLLSPSLPSTIKTPPSCTLTSRRPGNTSTHACTRFVCCLTSGCWLRAASPSAGSVVPSCSSPDLVCSSSCSPAPTPGSGVCKMAQGKMNAY